MARRAGARGGRTGGTDDCDIGVAELVCNALVAGVDT